MKLGRSCWVNILFNLTLGNLFYLNKAVAMFTNVFPRLHFSVLVFIQDMTKDQIANEKVALQKALLYYESIHGRRYVNALNFLFFFLSYFFIGV